MRVTETYFSHQDLELAGLRDFYPEHETQRFPIKDLEEISILEKSRLYFPISADVTFWLLQLQKQNLDNFSKIFTFSVDADGREFVEY